MLVAPDVLANASKSDPTDTDPTETAEWRDALEAVVKYGGPDRALFLLQTLANQVAKLGQVGTLLGGVTTPYVNTIPVSEQASFPGNRELERAVKSAVRWNAMAMVLRANKTTNVGGHIATFASAATLYEIGQNHFFKGRTDTQPGDVVFYQGHASPGMYARAYLEGA